MTARITGECFSVCGGGLNWRGCVTVAATCLWLQHFLFFPCVASRRDVCDAGVEWSLARDRVCYREDRLRYREDHLRPLSYSKIDWIQVEPIAP
jgi:hypothetical protein